MGFTITYRTEKGTVTISEDVFTWLAGDAASRCFGVKGMAALSKENGLVQLLRRESMSRGVTVRPEGEGIEIDLHIVMNRGVNVTVAAHSIRNEVSYKVSAATGVPVRRVNVFVDSMTDD